MDEWVPPDICLEAARWCLLNVPSRCMVRLLEAGERLFPRAEVAKGFQISEHGVERSGARRVLADRLAPLLAESVALRSILFVHSYPEARWHRWNEALSALDGGWVLASWRKMLKWLKDPALAVGMALDEREGIARRGCRLLLVPWLWDRGLEFHASQPPPELLDLISLVGAGREGRGEGSYTALQAQLRQSEKRASRLERRLHDAEAELARWKEESRRLKESLAGRREEVERLSRALDRLRMEQEERTEARIREVVAGIVGPSLVEELERAVIEGIPAEEIIAQADRALDAHRALDPRCGTRSAVRRWMARLEEKRREVQEALEDSLIPSRPLRRAMAAIDRELERLRSLLEPSRDVEMEPRQEGSTEEGRDPLPSMPPPAPQGPPSLKRGRGPVEIANLSAFVVQNPAECARAVLVVDGYNAIKGMAAWRSMEGRDLAFARSRFVQLLRARAGDWRGIEVVFDGKGRLAEADEEGRLSVVFTSDIGESQRADRYIVERLRILKEREGSVTFLVTADQGLREETAPYCDYFVDPRWAAIAYLAP